MNNTLWVIIVGLGALAWLGMAVCLVGIGVEARSIPNRPLRMRINPLNILTDQSLWTPDIQRLHRLAVRFGAGFILAILSGLVLGLLQ